MNRVPRVFSYRLVRDYGFAPNPFHGICTLGTCKPQIRKAAQVGDIIVGCGSVGLRRPERLIFAMRVSEKLSFQQYWEDERFRVKRPNLYTSESMAYGDNIYHLVNDAWVQEDSHHSHADGRNNQANLSRDTSSNNVLVGNDFVYWGGNAVAIPDQLRNFEGEDLYPPPRGCRSKFSENFRAEVVSWFESISIRGYRSRPASWL
jgi:hypothetical protein